MTDPTMALVLVERQGRVRLKREHVFHPTRKWRFDYALPGLKIAIEIEGAIWINGRHTRGKGFQADLIKYSEAAALGWLVLRFSYDDLKKNPTYVIRVICETIQRRRAENSQGKTGEIQCKPKEISATISEQKA